MKKRIRIIIFLLSFVLIDMVYIITKKNENTEQKKIEIATTREITGETTKKVTSETSITTQEITSIVTTTPVVITTEETTTEEITTLEPLLIENVNTLQIIKTEVHRVPITEKAINEPFHIIEEWEKEMICKIVQLEAGENASDYHKQLIAHVILSRSIDWNMSISDVITQQGQFSTYGMECTPNESTRQAVQNVLETPSILPVKYFYSVGNVSQETANWFESLLFCQEIEGHRFFFG